MKGFRDGLQFLPRGKGLGGSNQLNYLLHSSAIKEDFNRWERLGAYDWNYVNLKKFLNRHELHTNESNMDHGDMPKLSITTTESKDSKLTEAFLFAGREMQITFNPKITFNLAKFTLRNGIRFV